ncbi:MAG: sugar transferase [Alkalinema sp. RL_2_19]|nr:sugar transferase [Alkalinema sp. RL_2_19]
MVMRHTAEQSSQHPNHRLNQPNHLPNHGHYSLKWRQKTLVIRTVQSPHAGIQVSLDDLDWATDRLQRSPVDRVKLDRHFSAAELCFWADACAQAGKRVYLSLPSMAALPQKRKPLHWKTKCLIDRLAALVILTIISPILLLMACVIRRSTTESILIREWQVGVRGKLYQAFYFRADMADGTALPHAGWMRRYRFDRLPKLINVLCGEMSLVGACPRRLSDVPEVEAQFHSQLNTLPGITGTWHLASHLDLLDFSFLHQLDFHYIWNWSLQQDLKVLLISASKILAEESP